MLCFFRLFITISFLYLYSNTHSSPSFHYQTSSKLNAYVLYMEKTEPLEEDNEFLPRVDSDSLSSTSSTTTLFTLNSDDTNIITTSSSGDISASSSSGEIPAIIISEAVIAKLPTEISFDVVPGLTPNLKCVGRNNKGVTWGSTSVIGRRREMEDAVAAASGFISSTCDHVGGCTAPGSRCSGEVSPVHLFGVYDGHGGSQVAKYCAEKMHLVVAEEFYRETVNGLQWQRRWEETFSSSFKRVDSEAQIDALAPEMVGSTAVVVVLSGCQIIISNCGDSRAVLCRGTETIPLTVDQKPDREDELARIEGQGGKVINWKGARVFGVLAMSRAIGDWYLRPWIIPVPEITFATRSEEDECLILASDGLWDVMSNQEVGEVARRLLRRRRRLMADDEVSAAQFVADNLTEIAMGRNSSDNISIIVVDLKPKRKRQQRL